MTNPAFTIVIPSYQRPEKLLRRFREVIDWPRLEKVVYSIDAPRKNCSVSELSRNQEVIRTAEGIAHASSLVDVLVWQNNMGVNIHAARVFAHFRDFPYLIILEDDVSVNHSALDFLADSLIVQGSLAATAHALTDHIGIQSNLARETLFPAQWGVALTPEVMDKYLYVIKTKKLERTLIRKVFYATLKDSLSVLQIEILIQWWFNHFYFCERHGNWADAVIQYAVLSSGGLFNSPARSLVVDDNALHDSRSMNPRVEVASAIACSSGETMHEPLTFRCVSCEINGSRLHDITLSNILGGTKHRRVLQIRDRSSGRLKSD